jgi:hypothetical protein
MAGFNDREKGFENKFKHDEEMRFKAMARRNKLLGLWAAGLMGLEGEAANVYALEVVKADFEEAGDDDVLRKVLGDLESKGVETSTHIVRKHMDDLLHTAIAQVSSEG